MMHDPAIPVHRQPVVGPLEDGTFQVAHVGKSVLEKTLSVRGRSISNRTIGDKRFRSRHAGQGLADRRRRIDPASIVQMAHGVLGM